MAVNPYIEAENYVHALNDEETSDSLTLYTFPDNFQFYANARSSKDEAEIIYNEIMVKQEYIPSSVQLAADACVFDVGANIGVFSLFVKRNYPAARVYAFEPIADTFGIMRRNLALHDINDVVAANVAVGDTDGATKDFTYYLNLPSSSTSDPSTKELFRTMMIELFGVEQTDQFMEHVKQTVTVRTISSLIREHGIARIDLLKVDVEGDECAVLRGIEPEHYPLIQNVSMEVHSQENYAIAAEQLRAIGLTCFEDKGILANTDVIHLYAVREAR